MDTVAALLLTLAELSDVPCKAFPRDDGPAEAFDVPDSAGLGVAALEIGLKAESEAISMG